MIETDDLIIIVPLEKYADVCGLVPDSHFAIQGQRWKIN